MRRKSTKRTLWMSVLSLLLCVSMLIGTTFAWFTDSVTSGVNTITAGNLDIEVAYSKDNGANWADLKNAGDLFRADLWEPGHTEYVTLKVENKGTLAFNYKLLVTPVAENGGVNVDDEVFKLSDYLVYATTAPAAAATTYTRDTAREAAGTAQGLNVANLKQVGALAAGETQYITLVVYMPETVGNKANYKTGTQAPSIELGIQLVATQKTSEKDSFGDDYDKDATGYYTFNPSYDYYPQVVVSAPKAANGDTTLQKVQDNVSYAKAVIPAAAVDAAAETLTLTVKPAAASADTAAAEGVKAEIENSLRETANFDVKITGIVSGNTTPIAVDLFVGKGLSNVKVYHNGTLISGTNYDATTGIVSFTTTSFSDYTVAYDCNNWSNNAATAFATAVDTQNKVITVADAAELALFAKDAANYNGYTVKLAANIDLGAYLWIPISSWNGTFDGQGHTISGMYVNADKAYGNGFFSKFGDVGTAIMKNVTFDNALVQRGMGQYSGNMYGIIAGYAAYYGNVYFENVTVQNSTVWAFGKVGGFFGMAEAQGGTVSFKDCNVSNVTIKSGYNGGGYAGLIQYAVSGDRNTVIFDNCAEPTVTFVTSGIMRDGAASVKVGTLDGFYTVWGGNEYYADTAKYYNLYACPEADRANVDAIVCNDARNVEGTTWVAHAADAFSVIDTNAKTITVTNAAELARVSKVATTLTGYTVTLGANIDLAAYEWDPIDATFNTPFVFDGASYTISNLHINTTKSDIGLFGNATGATIKNVKMDNVNIIACQRVGAICGQMIAGSIDNCTVTNAVITAAPVWNGTCYEGAAKAGAIAGYLSNQNQAPATSCTVENATVTAYRDAGGVVGYAQGAVDLSGATVKDTTVTLVSVTPYETNDGAAPSANVGAIYGRFDSANVPVTTDSTVTNVTVTPAN